MVTLECGDLVRVDAQANGIPAYRGQLARVTGFIGNNVNEVYVTLADVPCPFPSVVVRMCSDGAMEYYPRLSLHYIRE